MKNNHGMTLLEMTITIFISSILIVILYNILNSFSNINKKQINDINEFYESKRIINELDLFINETNKEKQMLFIENNNEGVILYSTTKIINLDEYLIYYEIIEEQILYLSLNNPLYITCDSGISDGKTFRISSFSTAP